MIDIILLVEQCRLRVPPLPPSPSSFDLIPTTWPPEVQLHSQTSQRYSCVGKGRGGGGDGDRRRRRCPVGRGSRRTRQISSVLVTQHEAFNNQLFSSSLFSLSSADDCHAIHSVPSNPPQSVNRPFFSVTSRSKLDLNKKLFISLRLLNFRLSRMQ